MKTKERRERLQNKGFTLIELIVTIAIIAIFSGVVLTFISTGSNTYRSTSSSAKVQMETQETFDQIEDLIIDVNRSLYYANGSGDSLGAEIKNDIKQSGGANSTGDKTFIICNEYKNGTGNSQYICDVLDWDKDDATIYYSQKEYKAASSSAGNETSVESLMAAEDDTEEENAVDVGASESETKAKDLKMKVDRSVLATGILDFRADVSKVESNKIVRFQLSTQNGTKEIETLHSVSLRNTVEVKKPADSYDDAPSTSVGIKIINAPSSVDPGNSYTGVSLNGSQLTVTDEAGKDSTSGTVTLTATEKDSGANKSADLEVRIARIDLTQPVGTYKVGAVKPQPRTAQVYKESGQDTKIDGTEIAISAQKTNGTTGDYLGGANTFSADDVGEWTVNISYDLKQQGGYGTVHSQSTFTVEAKTANNGKIFIDYHAVDPDTVIAGRNYNCEPTVNWGFNFKPDVDGFWENSEIVWSLKDKYTGIEVYDGNPSAKTAKIKIDADVKTGFVICADYYKYTNSVKDTVKVHVHAEREFKVATGIELNALSDSDTVYVYKDNDPNAQGYEMHVLIDIYDANGKMTSLPVSSVDSETKVHWEGSGGYRVKSLENGNWAYYPPTYDVNKEIDISVWIEKINGIFDTESNYYNPGNYPANPNFKKLLKVRTIALPTPTPTPKP